MLVTFAVDWEFRPWIRLRSFSPVIGKQHLFRTEIGGSEVRVLLTGIGPHASNQLIHTVVDEVPDFCISSGLTGGLKQEHRPGDVLVARSVSAEAADKAFDSNEKLFGAAVECGAKAVSRFVSTERIIQTAKEKSEFHSFADAVDMESFTIMKAMSDWGVPCVSVRTVSDSAEADVPCDFNRALDASGRVRIFHVLGQALFDPRKVWPLAQFGAQGFRAASSLAHYLDRYTTYLAMNQERIESRVQ